MNERSYNLAPNTPESLDQETKELLSADIRSAIIDTPETAWWAGPLKAIALETIEEGTPKQASAAAEIILNDTLHGNPIPEMLGKGGPNQMFDKKRQLIGIANSQPELAHAIVANNVAGFHASNSSSLLGVLEHGILSSRESRDRGLALGSGERTYTNPKAPPFISFADWRDPQAIQNYSGNEQRLSLESLRAEKDRLIDMVENEAEKWGEDYLLVVNGRLLIEDTQRVIDTLSRDPSSPESGLIMANFPVAYGFDISGYNHVHSNVFIDSDSQEPVIADRMARTSIESEFALFYGSVPPRDIAIIAVPAHHVNDTRQLVQAAGHGIDVYPLDALTTEHRAKTN